ncbi:hypothetical protein [Clostridium hydrogenum]|uniref:hypothetical protein n=1 Tax=Clostridium hydrogenum TaxID=2855764 RepID=UPI001F17EC2E|nr:hypothetical protein [Clostridium hydrogenum]
MVSVKNIEKRIYDIESFEVNIINPDGTNCRSDKSLPKQYEATRMSKNSFTVGEWKLKFKKQYPGYTVEVLDGSGNPVDGHTCLSTVRDTY